MKVKTLGMMLVMAYQLVIPTSQAQPLDNKAMSYYCGNEDVEFKEQVTVGLATRVHLQDGSFYLLQEKNLYEPVIGLISQEIQNAGISKACADYLLSKGELNSGNSNDVIARVFFKFDSSQLTDSAKYILDNIVTLLAQDTKQIFLIGHTDNLGAAKYNFNLGLKRSKEVEAYLVSKGIDPAQLSSTSNGADHPINPNTTAAERENNRRVDMFK